MKYYKSEEGEVFAYESDGSQDSFIRHGLTLLNEEELIAVREAQREASAPSPEQILKDAIVRRDEQLAVAALRIAPLQYAVDIGEETPEEAAALLLWKKFSLDVSRVSAQEGFPSSVIWPIQPQ